QARLGRLEQAPARGPDAMVRLLARVLGVGVETADMLVHEVLSRNLRDRRAVARYAGVTGSPDESGAKRRGGVWRRRVMHESVAASYSWRGGSCGFRRRAPWPSGIMRAPRAPPGSGRRP